MTRDRLTTSDFTARDNPGLQWLCVVCEAKPGEPCTHADGEIVSDTFVMHLDRYDKWRELV